jgi:hypothetical protein
MAVEKIIEGRRVRIDVGTPVENEAGRCEKLLPCNDWDRAEFRFPQPIAEFPPIALNVEITGRTFQSRPGGGYQVRVRMVWRGDGEPDQECKGWAIVSPWDCERVD